jgi:hypothetical protein
LDAAGNRVQETTENLVYGCRSVCNGLERATPKIFFMDPPATSASNERLFSQLAGPSGVCIPPVCPHPTGYSENQEGRSQFSIGLPTLAVTGLVHPFVTTIDRLPSHFHSEFAPDSLSNNGSAPITTIQKIHTIRLDVVRRRFQDRGFLNEVVKLLLESNRKTTATTYQSAWNGWIDGNNKRGSDTLLLSLNSILQYLTDLFNSGVSYSTVNIHRSMLSSTLEAIDGHEIGEHPLVVQLLKGCFNIKPPQPRYNHIWDPEVILKHFKSLGENQNLSLKTLSKKLAMLLALSTVSRVSEINSISFQLIKITPESAVFSLLSLRKAQKSGSLQSCTLPRFSGVCCPVDCLESYIRVSENLRSNQISSSLFVSVRKPHKPIGSSTLGRWIKTCMTDAGLDPATFSAHSTRGAAASKAVKQGVPIEYVLHAVNWSRESTFRKFYHRDLINFPVAEAVLTQQTSLD